MNETQQYQKNQTDPTNFLVRLWNGDVGLAKIYWLWGVVAAFIWGVAFFVIKPVPGSTSVKLLVFLMAAYFVFVYVGIWRAAKKYQGKKIWATLAKFAVVIGVLITVLPLLAVVVEKVVS